MTIQQLRYLISVAQSPSINQAAQDLYVSQSSISKSLKQLEDELGFPLMERNSRGVVFTPRGLAFLRDAHALVSRFDSFTQQYSHNDPDEFNFTVSSQHYLFILMAVARTVNLLDKHFYSVNLREHKTSMIIDDVRNRRSQLGFIYYSPANRAFLEREVDRAGLIFHPFYSAVPHVYLSCDHPLANEASLSLSQLKDYPYTCYDPDTDSSDFIEEISSPASPSKIILVSDRCSLFNLIRNTTTYSIGSGILADGYTDENICTIPLLSSNDSPMEIGWIYPAGQPVSPDVEQFVVLCREALADCYTGSTKDKHPMVPAP